MLPGTIPAAHIKTMLLIGSKALKHYSNRYINSNVKRSWDNDFICTYDEFVNFKNKFPYPKTVIPYNHGKTLVLKSPKGIWEFEIAWEDSTAEKLLKLVKENNLSDTVNGMDIANPNVIFTLKKSHRYLKDSPHFMKTMLDYRYLRDKLDCVVPEKLTDWYKEREKETYWYSHPKLNQSKDMFFNKTESYNIFDHDTVHLAVKHLDRPAYEYFKPENSEVQCSKKMFFEADEMTRLYSVVEESYVLALERSQIPNKDKPIWTPRQSFEYALMKVSTSITSGWFRQYCYEHYFDAIKLYDDTYVERFWEAVNNGIVKLFVKEKQYA